jgi:hypothetical protein
VTNPADTVVELSVLDRPRRRRPEPSRLRVGAQRVIAFGCAALLVVTAVTLASGSDNASEVALVEGVVPPPSPGGGSVSPGGALGSGVTGSAGGPFDGAAGAVGGGGSEAGFGGDNSGPATGGSGPTGGSGSAIPEDPAIIGVTLRFLQFGSGAGLPLACSVATSALNSGISDPAFIQLTSGIAAGCVEFGTTGAQALAQLDEQLAALAALNPLLVPGIEAFADLVDAFAQQGPPFQNFIEQLVSILRFFKGESNQA